MLPVISLISYMNGSGCFSQNDSRVANVADDFACFMKDARSTIDRYHLCVVNS